MSKTGTYIVNLREKYKEVMMDCEDLVKPFFCGLSGRECNINNCPVFPSNNCQPSYHHARNQLRG